MSEYVTPCPNCAKQIEFPGEGTPNHQHAINCPRCKAFLMYQDDTTLRPANEEEIGDMLLLLLLMKMKLTAPTGTKNSGYVTMSAQDANDGIKRAIAIREARAAAARN